MNYYSVGIDEVGRGPVAGPVLVCACKMKHYKIPKNIIIKDSKKMSLKQREETYLWLKDNTEFYTARVTAKIIDNIGISKAISRAISKCIKNFDNQAFFFMDGNFSFGIQRPHDTIVKGDIKILEIASASIIAKVERDRYMMKLAKKYPEYGWDRNAGYGTRSHILAIRKYGLTEYHRESFLKKYNGKYIRNNIESITTI